MLELGDFMKIRRRLQVEDLLNREIGASLAPDSRHGLTALAPTTAYLICRPPRRADR